jgi:signal peptidase I
MRRLFDYRQVPRAARTRILAAMMLGSVLSYFGCSRFVIGMGEVVGQSMWPNLVDGERLLINRVAYRLGDPRPGDVVALRFPNEDDWVVKRVIAQPGDMVRIRGGRVWVNGRALMEPYLPMGVPTLARAMRDRSYRIAGNCYFVLGDNRLSSDDSRMFGAVSREQFVGRVVLRKQVDRL